jgi:S-adenosylmethionine hydrolase
VPEGEKVCLFGSNGLMEIAINKGNGSGLLGLKTGHPILIEFE